jgi:HEAT repeat protein
MTMSLKSRESWGVAEKWSCGEGNQMSEASHDFSASHWLDVLKTTETADRQWKKAVKSLAAMGLRVVPALIEATGNDHAEVRRGTSQALHKIGPAIIPFLIKALRNDNASVREAAARGLYGFAPKAQTAIPALTDAIQDSDAFVRQWVATALENMARHFGPTLKVAAPGLTALLTDEDFMVREWAAHALGSIGDAAVPVIAALEKALEDENTSVKEAAASALREIQKPR